jgi:fructose-bisphosphate aldolase class I
MLSLERAADPFSIIFRRGHNERHRDRQPSGDEMLRKIEQGQGFIAALDQSGGSPGALGEPWHQRGRLLERRRNVRLIHQMRSRIITSRLCSAAARIGAILFERTMDGEAGGKPVPELLRERGVVPS